MKDRTRAWRRRQTRKVMTKIEETKEWLGKTMQKRKADRPAPIPAIKPHKHGKLTRIQKLRQQMSLQYQQFDDGSIA